MTSAAASDEVSEDRFLQIVEAICASDSSLTPVSSALLAAHHLGIAKDSRTFSRNLGIAHALVLREISAIAGEDGFLSIVGRNERTHRIEFALTDKGKRLADLAGS
jgi:hypothetical protein